MTTTTTTTLRRPRVAPTTRPDGFEVVTSATSLGYNLPQRMARRLWLPMLLLAFSGWTIGLTLAIVEASTERSDADTLQRLSHLVPAFMFIGFLGVFSAITFAVARILGFLRKGGGEVQETSGGPVQTLAMPATGKAMLGFMAMGMMVMAAGIAANFWAASNFGVEASDVLDSRSWAAAASGLRRMGVAFYLTGIAFGLGTIIHVLRFQSIRIREVAQRAVHSRD